MKKTKSQLMKKADEVFSEYIRARDGVCLYGVIYGECSGGLQCSHVISKGSCSELRYDPNNSKTLCSKHHLFGWHSKNPAPYVAWFIQTYPKRWEYLQEKYETYKQSQGKNKAFRPTIKYYEDIISFYQEKLKDYRKINLK